MACRSTVLLLPAVPCGRMACVLFWFGRPRECESRGEIRGSAPKPPLRPRFSAEAQLLCDVSCGKKGGSAPSQFISQASSVRLGAKQPPCKMGAKQQPPPAVGSNNWKSHSKIIQVTVDGQQSSGRGVLTGGHYKVAPSPTSFFAIIYKLLGQT